MSTSAPLTASISGATIPDICSIPADCLSDDDDDDDGVILGIGSSVLGGGTRMTDGLWASESLLTR